MYVFAGLYAKLHSYIVNVCYENKKNIIKLLRILFP